MNEKIRFDDQVIIVTGAGNGIGREYALLLAKLGGKVVVNDYGGSAYGEQWGNNYAQQVVDEIIASGGEAIADQTDVSQKGAGDIIVKSAIEQWGRVDVLINNAGSSRGGMSIETTMDEDFDFTMNVHFGGTYRLIRAVWPHMVKQKAGRIINTSSDSIWGTSFHPYVAAKSAVFGLTRSVAAEGKEHNIIVNSIMPSAWTRMTADIPPGDFRDQVEQNFKAEHVALSVAVLAHSSFTITGEAFQIGGKRIANNYLANTRGYQMTSEQPLEELAANFDAVLDREGAVTPTDMLDSVEVALSYLK